LNATADSTDVYESRQKATGASIDKRPASAPPRGGPISCRSFQQSSRLLQVTD
jgi:hypothetical protein